MWIWFRFDPGDAPGVRVRLNALAARGWELAEGQDCACFLARMERTGRGELSYDVEAASPFRTEEELEEQVRLRAAEGWESVATINGMDIYRAAPLRFPEPHSSPAGRGALAQGWAFGWLVLAAAAGVSLWLLLTGGTEWFLSNARLYLRFTGLPAALGALCFLVWQVKLLLGGGNRGTERGMYFRSVLGVLGLVWLFGLCLGLALDWLKWPMVLLVALCWLGAVVGGSGLWRRKSFGKFVQVSALATGIAVLSVAALTLVYPAGERAELLQAGDRGRYQAAVALEDLSGAEGEFLSGRWERTGSLLVTKVSCEEWWLMDGEKIRVASAAYRCPLGTGAWVTASLRTGEGSAFAWQGDTVVWVETTLDVDAAALAVEAESAAGQWER